MGYHLQGAVQWVAGRSVIAHILDPTGVLLRAARAGIPWMELTLDFASRNGVAMNGGLRILYAAGPGDVLGTYLRWKTGSDDPSQVNMTLSGMFFDICRTHGDSAYVISSCVRPGRIQDGRFTIEHRKTLFQTSSGLRYHFGQIWTALRLLASAIRFRADVAVIVCGTAHWFPMRLFKLFGIKVVASLHCTLWRKYRPPRGVTRLVRRLNRPFFTKTVTGVLSMSHDITSQLAEMTRGRHKPVEQFLPTYRRDAFEGISEPLPGQRPFRVFFAGRIERDKGVFDLLEIAKRFKAEKRDDVIIDVCGSGNALADLKAEVEAAGVGDRLICHGYANRSYMREMYSRSHVVIVPTTTDFIEGFNQVVAEAVLAGRPVITSDVCPAVHYLRDAVVEVPPDNARAYGDAIIQLADDAEFYRSKCVARVQLQAPFYDLAYGWSAALEKAMEGIRAVSGSKDRKNVEARSSLVAGNPL